MHTAIRKLIATIALALAISFATAGTAVAADSKPQPTPATSSLLDHCATGSRLPLATLAFR